MQGRDEILRVHARGKRIAEDVDMRKVARATAGFTGADLMNLMNASAVLAVRSGEQIITEATIFQVGSMPLLELERIVLHVGADGSDD